MRIARFIFGCIAYYHPLTVKPEEDSAEREFGLRRDDLLAMTPGDRSFALEQCIQGHVAQVLQLPARHIDTNEPLGLYGLESAKGNELLAVLAKSLSLSLPATTVFNYPTISELSRHIASLMEIPLEPSGAIAPETAALEDSSILEFLGAVERTSVSEMQQII